MEVDENRPGSMEDRLGKLAMRVIAFGIVAMMLMVLIAKGLDTFPFGVAGLIGGCVLAVTAFAVGEVE